MQIGQTLYVTDRKQWRVWLAKHHRTAPDIWLIYFKKHSGKPRIPWRKVFETRLRYFLKMTARNKRYGMLQ